MIHQPHLKPIGVIRSPLREAAGTPIQAAVAGDAEGALEVLEELAGGFRDLEGFRRIWVLYWFDRAVADGRCERED
jgi:tRNA (Thr-GGU) A37 N-methylase